VNKLIHRGDVLFAKPDIFFLMIAGFVYKS